MKYKVMHIGLDFVVTKDCTKNELYRQVTNTLLDAGFSVVPKDEEDSDRKEEIR